MAEQYLDNQNQLPAYNDENPDFNVEQKIFLDNLKTELRKENAIQQYRIIYFSFFLFIALSALSIYTVFYIYPQQAKQTEQLDKQTEQLMNFSIEAEKQKSSLQSLENIINVINSTTNYQLSGLDQKIKNQSNYQIAVDLSSIYVTLNLLNQSQYQWIAAFQQQLNYQYGNLSQQKVSISQLSDQIQWNFNINVQNNSNLIMSINNLILDYQKVIFAVNQLQSDQKSNSSSFLQQLNQLQNEAKSNQSSLILQLNYLNQTVLNNLQHFQFFQLNQNPIDWDSQNSQTDVNSILYEVVPGLEQTFEIKTKSLVKASVNGNYLLYPVGRSQAQFFLNGVITLPKQGFGCCPMGGFLTDFQQYWQYLHYEQQFLLDPGLYTISFRIQNQQSLLSVHRSRMTLLIIENVKIN